MNYPKDIKAFYMRVNDDGKTVAAMDVLAPGIGEIIGGSQREERLDVLDARMTERAHRQGALRLVPRPAPLRHRAARRLRPRLRAHARLRHRPRQHARRDPVPAHAGTCAVLSCIRCDLQDLVTIPRSRPGNRHDCPRSCPRSGGVVDDGLENRLDCEGARRFRRGRPALRHRFVAQSSCASSARSWRAA